MSDPTRTYLWQGPMWPSFRWDAIALLEPLAQARLSQGRLLEAAEQLDITRRHPELQAQALVEEILGTSAIEGERLDVEAVRSSVARRLGVPTAGYPQRRSRQAEAVLDILLDATSDPGSELTGERLCRWHRALFPTGQSGLHEIWVGAWREGPMAVVSGPITRQRVHFEAPSAERVEDEMRRLLSWWNHERGSPRDGLLRAAIAPLWFLTIHPFEDGNGRIARAVADRALAEDESAAFPCRLYSLSRDIEEHRDAYYEVIETTQAGDGDITRWIAWFLHSFRRSVDRARETFRLVLLKARFWAVFAADLPINDRQRKALNRLLDAGPGGFEGGLTTRKYQGLADTNRVTAYRDLSDLAQRGLLERSGEGRGTRYDIPWNRLKERAPPVGEAEGNPGT